MRRRSLLGWSLVGGVALALAGTGAAWLHARGWYEGRLLPAGRAVLAGVARAILDGNLPDSPAALSAALDAHLERMESLLRGLPPHTQAEVADLLAILGTPPLRLALTGSSGSWDEAPIVDLQATLQSMRTSSLTLRRQTYGALRDLTHAAYYGDSSTWHLLGYPGPKAIA